MSLTLYMHPLASFCHKPLIALYENGTPFRAHQVDLGNAQERAAFYKLWPIGRFPLLHDATRDCLVPESSIIIEYLDQRYRGPVTLIPDDPDLAREVRLRDRFFDIYVNETMQKVVTDRLRPSGQHDHYGVAEARDRLRVAYDVLERDMEGRTWMVGDAFSMADCAASPALFYANLVIPLEDAHPRLAAYLLRLMQRPAFSRVLAEAQPYMHLVPREAAHA
ncbi:MAG TPA: glutathione S-transferase family protein [Dyella sp.]|uniref:glutathione S-transferase family protein n=1 Tax=Dyella sp. TaxID=1869338 RepID=UPI002D78E898|nr:glutathione S-transferase family protein [Dyella sp.]HET6555246.1 glutathione S-transferase family protein [Dyella sp.]